VRNPGAGPLLDGVLNTDTLAGTVVRGDIVVGNTTPKWSRKAVGTGVLVADGTDVTGWSQAPTLTTPSMTTPVISTLLDLTAGQIKFPATQVPSSDANTLDDYEEGSWTPVLGGSGGTSGQSYTVQTGRYVKIGKFIHCHGRIVLSAKGTITTALELQGLPFASENITDAYGTCDCPRFQTFTTTNIIHVSGYISPGVTVARLTTQTAASLSNVEMTTSNVGNTSEIMFSLWYRTTA